MRTAAPHSRFVAALVVALTASAASPGCGSDFDPPTYLAPGSLRLLGTRAEPAEPRAGETVTLEALLTDGGSPAGADVTVEWRRCTLAVNAAATNPVNPACLTSTEPGALVPLGMGRTVSFTMPEIDPRTLGIPDGTLGLYTPIRITVRASSGRVLEGIYRLRVHPTVSPLPSNNNPRLAGMWFVADAADRDAGTWPSVGDGFTAIPDASAGVPAQAVEILDGQPFEMRNPGGWTLRALFADGSIERYTAATTDLSGKTTLSEKSETLTARWYASAGNVETPVTGVEISDSRLLLNKFPPASGQIVDVYVVGRDERAGTTWLHRQLRFR